MPDRSAEPAALSEFVSLVRRYRTYDPSARSSLEIALLYPGVRALVLHRLAHALWRSGAAFFARAVAEYSRWLSGIEIHPGAVIGRGLIIDHGMGVVIGETAVIGENCILYQGVTLGGTELIRRKRHPTLEDGVVVGAGAKILGAITVGTGSRVGANSVVVHDVPAHSTAVGIPARVLPRRGVVPGGELSHALLEEDS